MKTTTLFSLALIASTSLLAQTPPQQPPSPPPAGTPTAEATPPEGVTAPQTYVGDVEVGTQGVHNDTGSGKFFEYRDVPKGPVLPLFRIRTDAPGYDWQIAGENIARNDQHYFVRADVSNLVRVNADFNQIPHNWGVGHTLEQQTGPGSWEISDTLQAAFQNAIQQQFNTNKAGINYPFLLNLVSPSLATANAVDLGLLRKRGFVDFNILPDAAVNTHVSYFAESRTGNRAAGTSFGFGNVVETPEPINYRTTEVGLTAEMPITQGLVRGGFRINRFRDELSSYSFDNPFRVTSSTDPSAYTAPGSGSINGAAFGRISTPPDNEALNGSLGIIYKLPYKSRLTADINLGRWKQNDPFIPYTSNVAITTDVFPATSLNGKVNTTGANLQFTSSPVKNLNLTARYRYYDFDNRSPRITFPGYVRFDAVWEAIPRNNAPYSFKRSRADVTADYNIGIGDLEAGFRSETRHHTFRAVERDTENVIRLGGDVKPTKWSLFRVSYEFGNRNVNGYDLEEEEDASFVQPQAPVNPPIRRYDINARRVQRLVSTLQLMPLDGNLTFDVNYIYNLDRYKNAPYGLQRWKNDAFTTEADYAPTDRWSAYAFFSNEFLGGVQIDEQNSNGVLSLDPRNDWIANNSDRVKSIGAGFNYAIVPQKIDGHFLLRFQRANGFADLTTAVENSNLHPRSIPNFDDTKLWTTSAEVLYHATPAIDVALGAWIEKYNFNDAESSNLPNYAPAAFFLAPNDLDYRGTVAYVRAAYHW